MSYALDAFRAAWRGPFDGLTEKHAQLVIERVSKDGVIGEDDPQQAGLWNALAVIWAADWRAMTDAAERDKQMHDALKLMAERMQAGVLEMVAQVEKRRSSDAPAAAPTAQIDPAELARAIAAQVQMPRIDTDELARKTAALVPASTPQVHQHYDVVDTFRHALREGFSWMWAGAAGLVLFVAAAFTVRTYLTDQNTIAGLRAQVAALSQQIADSHQSAGNGKRETERARRDLRRGE